MNAKYLGLIAVGILAVGSFSVLAKDVAPVYQVSSVPNESVSNNTYDAIKQMIDEQVESGRLTQQQGEEMLDYCIDRMESTDTDRNTDRNTNRNTNSNTSGRRNRCH